ncbi:MAG: PEP-CTERM sorting domain-containing protein [Candidatus Accumulibacter sp. UW20]|jgi:hypothetical protein
MKRFVRVIAAAMVLFGAAGLAQAFEIIAPDQPVAGKSQLEWSQEWWQWALGAPASDNPLLDPDGSLAQVGNNGPVFFVAGSIFGVPTDRTFTVPAGRPIFFPVINNLWIETPPIVCFPDFPCALDQITPFITDATDLHATLDGQNLLIPDALGFRQTSSEFFLIALPDDNLFGAPEDAYPAVSDGYWVAVEGLSPGPHTLIFGATSGDFLVEVTANLTVPEPGTLGLVLLGALVATGRFRSGTAVTPRQPA